MDRRVGLLVGAGLLLLAATQEVRAGQRKDIKRRPLRRRDWDIEDIVIYRAPVLSGPQYGPALGGNPAGSGGSVRGEVVSPSGPWAPEGEGWQSVLGEMISDAPDPAPVWVDGVGWKFWRQNGQTIRFPDAMQGPPPPREVAMVCTSEVYPSFGGSNPVWLPPGVAQTEIENGVWVSEPNQIAYLDGNWQWFYGNPGDVYLIGLWVKYA